MAVFLTGAQHEALEYLAEHGGAGFQGQYPLRVQTVRVLRREGLVRLTGRHHGYRAEVALTERGRKMMGLDPIAAES